MEIDPFVRFHPFTSTASAQLVFMSQMFFRSGNTIEGRPEQVGPSVWDALQVSTQVSKAD